MPVSIIPLGVLTQHTGSGVLHAACDLVDFEVCDCVSECLCVSGRGGSSVLCLGWMIRDFFMLVYLC